MVEPLRLPTTVVPWFLGTAMETAGATSGRPSVVCQLDVLLLNWAR